MNTENFTQKIETASSLAELMHNGLLPDPNDDGSYFFFYYSRKDFKKALKDIVTLSDLGLRIWYDRKQEGGASWKADMLSRASDFHCAAVVFYLSESAMQSAFFWQLCTLVAERHLVYCPVNLPDENGNAFSFRNFAAQYPLTSAQNTLAEQLFGEEITYVPYAVSAEEKKTSLERIGKDNLLLYTVEGDSATVLCVKDLAEEEIVIPEYTTISGVEYPVRRIAPRAFANCNRLKKIIIPDSVEYVGEFSDDSGEGSNIGQAFFECTALEEIKMPANLKVLRMNNFENCSSLKKLYFGDNVEKIVEADGVFDGLEELRLPSLIKRTQEGKYLYFDERWKYLPIETEGHIYGCEEIELTATYVPEKGSVIGYLYRDSTLLREVDASKLDDEPFDAYFWNCTGLEKVTLPQSIRSMSYTFSGCTSLSGVVLPESLEEIGAQTFSECNFQQLVIPQNVSSVSYEAFEGATISTLISDSKHNDRIFALDNQYNRTVSMLEQAGKKHVKLYSLLLPIKLLGPLFRLLIRGNIIALFLIITFPVSFWFMMFGGGKTITEYANVSQLYLGSGTYKKVPHGWKRTPSDKAGYDRFVPRKNR